MKQVGVNFSAWACMAAPTRGWECPTFMTPIPPAKSIYSRPSTSRIRAPLAESTYMEFRLACPGGMNRARAAGGDSRRLSGPAPELRFAAFRSSGARSRVPGQPELLHFPHHRRLADSQVAGHFPRRSAGGHGPFENAFLQNDHF